MSSAVEWMELSHLVHNDIGRPRVAVTKVRASGSPKIGPARLIEAIKRQYEYPCVPRSVDGQSVQKPLEVLPWSLRHAWPESPMVVDIVAGHIRIPLSAPCMPKNILPRMGSMDVTKEVPKGFIWSVFFVVNGSLDTLKALSEANTSNNCPNLRHFPSSRILCQFGFRQVPHMVDIEEKMLDVARDMASIESLYRLQSYIPMSEFQHLWPRYWIWIYLFDRRRIDSALMDQNC
ncbi:hypothetical protein C8R44DRAFT_855982 [Mycena epipterygia]|nr:hypothetical protein C8R44DRAFT_855982 [Mycena epipterygia]